MANFFPQHDAARRLTLPVVFPNMPSHLVEVQGTSSDELRARLGEPNSVSNDEGLGPTEAWAFEYPCGLQLVYLFYRLVGNLIVSADSPEVQHAIRHLPFPSDRVTTIPRDGLESQLEALAAHFPKRGDEINGLTTFQVCRMDDNGNVFAVDEPTSERDARCRVLQLERLTHKQTYWYERRKA